MIYENKSFNTWEDVIMCFFENKVENIQNTDPKIPCQIFKAREYIDPATLNRTQFCKIV